MLVQGLNNVLAADAGVKALVGTPTSRKDGTEGLFPVFAPDNCNMPYVVYSQVSGNPTTTSFQGTNKLQTARWRFSCYGQNYKTAKLLQKALKTALIGLLGTLAVGNAEVRGAWVLLEADEAESLPHGTIHVSHIDFEFLYLDNE
jgi:hypothetical protein